MNCLTLIGKKTQMSLFSVNTNLGALAALQSPDTTQQQLTQNEDSTGLKVGTASDNPAIHSISNTIDSNVAGLPAVSDSLNLDAQIVSTASSAVAQVSSVLANLQQTVTSAGTSGLDLTTLQQLVGNDLTQINSYANQSTFTGVNLLSKVGAGVTSTAASVVQGLDGSTLRLANQTALPGGAGATNLTDALVITGLNVAAGGTTGFQVAFNSSLSAGNFAPASTAGGQTAAPGTDAAFQLTTGTGSSAHIYSFEFTDDGATNAIPLQTSQNANTTIVAVHVNSMTQSTNHITGDLISLWRSNGFGVLQNTDGSLNVTGTDVQGASFGDVKAGIYTANTGLGVTTTALTGSRALTSSVETAITKDNTIAANLGAVSQQIAGIQTFTCSLSSALTAGVGALTDADLASESARLRSLQTKQQLATQSLSIANKQPQSLLSLFQQ